MRFHARITGFAAFWVAVLLFAGVMFGGCSASDPSEQTKESVNPQQSEDMQTEQTEQTEDMPHVDIDLKSLVVHDTYTYFGNDMYGQYSEKTQSFTYDPQVTLLRNGMLKVTGQLLDPDGTCVSKVVYYYFSDGTPFLWNGCDMRQWSASMEQWPELLHDENLDYVEGRTVHWKPNEYNNQFIDEYTQDKNGHYDSMQRTDLNFKAFSEKSTIHGIYGTESYTTYFDGKANSGWRYSFRELPLTNVIREETVVSRAELPDGDSLFLLKEITESSYHPDFGNSSGGAVTSFDYVSVRKIQGDLLEVTGFYTAQGVKTPFQIFYYGDGTLFADDTRRVPKISLETWESVRESFLEEELERIDGHTIYWKNEYGSKGSITYEIGPNGLISRTVSKGGYVNSAGEPPTEYTQKFAWDANGNLFSEFWSSESDGSNGRRDYTYIKVPLDTPFDPDASYPVVFPVEQLN